MVEEVIEDPADARRLYNERGKEIDLEDEIKNSRIRDRSRKLVNGDILRKSGKVYDADGIPLNGKVLGRISLLLDSVEKLKSRHGSYEDEINKSAGTGKALDEDSIGSINDSRFGNKLVPGLTQEGDPYKKDVRGS